MKYLILIFFCLICCITVYGQYDQKLIQHVNKATPQFDAVKATALLINTIPPAVRIKANNYCEGGYYLLLWNFLYAAFVAWLFLFCGLSACIKKLACKTTKKNRSNLIYITLYFLLSFLLTLPIDMYQNFIREQQYGFSNQNFIQWFSNDLLTFLVELIIAVPFCVLIYAIFRKVKENWWLWGAGVTIIVIIGVIIIYPVFISPIFNSYTLLKNGTLKERILSMARGSWILHPRPNRRAAL